MTEANNEGVKIFGDYQKGDVLYAVMRSDNVKSAQFCAYAARGNVHKFRELLVRLTSDEPVFYTTEAADEHMHQINRPRFGFVQVAPFEAVKNVQLFRLRIVDNLYKKLDFFKGF